MGITLNFIHQLGPTMTEALTKVMSKTIHGLCMWHLMQNEIKHLSNLMKREAFLN